MALATCEVVWIDKLLREFGIPKQKVIPLFCDNNVAIYITSNPAFHERTKHIEIDCHTIRDRYVSGLIKPLHVPAESQVADIFTEPLSSPDFARLVSKMGLHNLHSPS